MGRAVLISIRPKWCELIISGKKTIEVRKTRPSLTTPFKCYIYCTKFHPGEPDSMINLNGRTSFYMPQCGAVIGEFICDYIQNLFYDSDVRYGIDYPNDYSKKIMDGSCLSLWDMLDYLNGKDGYMWHISNLKIYFQPKPLIELRKPLEDLLGWNGEITRPPQSWCYVGCTDDG